MAGLEPTQSFHPNGFYVPVLLPFVALMHRKRLTIVAVEEYRSIALWRYRLFRTLDWLSKRQVRLRWPGLFRLEIICSTIFDSWLRTWEWHKEKKHRHPHLNLNLLLPKPVDA